MYKSKNLTWPVVATFLLGFFLLILFGCGSFYNDLDRLRVEESAQSFYISVSNGPQVLRFDDMSGTNQVELDLSAFGGVDRVDVVGP